MLSHFHVSENDFWILHVQLNQKMLLMQVLCYHYHSTMCTHRSISATRLRWERMWTLVCNVELHGGGGMRVILMSNETSEYMMLNFQMHLTFNSSPMLVVQSCCFLFVGWRGNSSGFYMKIAFSLPPFNIKIFYNFQNGNETANHHDVHAHSSWLRVQLFTEISQIAFSTKIPFFSHQNHRF